MSTEASVNFVQAAIESDLAVGRHGGRVATRFPPEPNGYLHIGHAKSIFLNFGLARRFGGTCNLRFDDTNPATEDVRFAEAILADLRWLGFEPDAVLHASDYYETLYLWAEKLILEGKAYVDASSLEEIRAMRGSVTEPGTAAEGRDRPAEENLRLFRDMRAGKFADGAMVLRAKIDLSHPNMKMRDPLLYRIRRAHHWRTGDAWCIYPMYDWAHGQSDAIEGITHSICTLEFENNRELYDWFLATLGTDTLGVDVVPRQMEFARLDLTYTVMSKRKLLQLVEGGHVQGWDDPRMSTVAGMRRRGVTPSAIARFAEAVGVARAMSTVEVELLESCLREDLNEAAPRRMVVVDPLEVEILGWPQGEVGRVIADDFPMETAQPATRREVPFSGRVYIERDDFAVDPPKGFKRLVPGGLVRLRWAHVIRCEEVVTDADGRVVGLRARIVQDEEVARGAKGAIHWVSADHGVPVVIEEVGRLFSHPNPGAEEDFLAHLAPNSLVRRSGFAEPAVAQMPFGSHIQMERVAFAFRAPETASEGLVLTTTVALKDGFQKVAPARRAAAAAGADDPKASAEAQANARAAVRAARRASDAAYGERHDAAVAAGLAGEEPWLLAEAPERFSVWQAAVALGADAAAVARLVCHAWPDPAGALTVPALAGLAGALASGAVAWAGARRVVAVLGKEGGDWAGAVRSLGLDRTVDVSSLVAEILAAHPTEAARLAGGDRRLLGFFTGLGMKAAQGAVGADAIRAALEATIPG
ncbi:MAG: hypothetical protein RLZZ383_1370 [Pseudomonadota bacterium]